jgi:hypothetical protein
VAGETGTIRIGDLTQQRTFIAGISAVAVTGPPVVVGAGGQFGVAASSQQFKDDIAPMEQRAKQFWPLSRSPSTTRKILTPIALRSSA